MIARSYCDETLPNSRRQTVVASGFFSPKVMIPLVSRSVPAWAVLRCFPGGDLTLIRRVCATGVLNLSPCSGVGKPKKDTLFWSYHSFHCTVLYCIVLHCTVLYCTALHCIVLYCIVLYCRQRSCLRFTYLIK